MSEIAINNNMGRDFGIDFVGIILNGKPNKVILRKGLTLLSGEVWDKIKSHPAIKRLMDTEQTDYLSRFKIISGSNDDKREVNAKIAGDKKKRMLEVIDYRKIDIKSKAKE